MASLVSALADTFLPAVCGRCGHTLHGRPAAGVCESCWRAVERHRGESCPRCGRPGLAEPGPCLTCRDTPPAWDAAASVGPYAGSLRDLVLLLKQRRHDELAAPLAELLAEVFRAAGWEPPAAVVGVPMHWWRRWRRGFNQAELLAGHLAARLGVPRRAPLRRRAAAPQVGRARSERLRLSARAFRPVQRVRGSIVLVDDVLTTGATAAACTLALRQAGAAEVRVLALARTPDPRSLA